ncbi:Uncharacterized protein APZ42_014339 [Daphnia magna]|uniref:Uncharacterized protein n=1 Tax=Daphnia magna TaxID=35525 RepID=A0A162Q7N5_9CRUS|nr:Uncharacterized protein APZ42_014339 [Daphnia magna]
MGCCRLLVRAVQFEISLEAVHVNSVSAPWILDGFLLLCWWCCTLALIFTIRFTSLIHQHVMEQVRPV